MTTESLSAQISAPTGANPIGFLPFEIHPVCTSGQAREVLALRHAAYSRHAYSDELKASLQNPDELDTSGLSTTLVAVSKDNGSIQGTVRVAASFDCAWALPEEAPADPCLSEPYTYIDRFAVSEGSDALVVPALIKAMWLWSLGRNSRWHVALAMAPLARKYRRWGGLTVRAGGQKTQLTGYHDDPYYLVAADLSEVREYLLTVNPEFAGQFIQTVHPDIRVHGACAELAWSQPVKEAGRA